MPGRAFIVSIHDHNPSSIQTTRNTATYGTQASSSASATPNATAQVLQPHPPPAVAIGATDAGVRQLTVHEESPAASDSTSHLPFVGTDSTRDDISALLLSPNWRLEASLLPQHRLLDILGAGLAALRREQLSAKVTSNGFCGVQPQTSNTYQSSSNRSGGLSAAFSVYGTPQASCRLHPALPTTPAEVVYQPAPSSTSAELPPVVTVGLPAISLRSQQSTGSVRSNGGESMAGLAIRRAANPIDADVGGSTPLPIGVPFSLARRSASERDSSAPRPPTSTLDRLHSPPMSIGRSRTMSVTQVATGEDAALEGDDVGSNASRASSRGRIGRGLHGEGGGILDLSAEASHDSNEISAEHPFVLARQALSGMGSGDEGLLLAAGERGSSGHFSRHHSTVTDTASARFRTRPGLFRGASSHGLAPSPPHSMTSPPTEATPTDRMHRARPALSAPLWPKDNVSPSRPASVMDPYLPPQLGPSATLLPYAVTVPSVPSTTTISVPARSPTRSLSVTGTWAAKKESAVAEPSTELPDDGTQLGEANNNNTTQTASTPVVVVATPNAPTQPAAAPAFVRSSVAEGPDTNGEKNGKEGATKSETRAQFFFPSPPSSPTTTSRLGSAARDASASEAPLSSHGPLPQADVPPTAAYDVPPGTSNALTFVPLKLLHFYQDYVCNRFIDGRSMRDTIVALREGQRQAAQPPAADPPADVPPLATPETLPLMDAIYWRGKWYGMGNRRLTCYHFVYGKDNPDKLIPVIATHVADDDQLQPQGNGLQVKVGGGILIDGHYMTTMSHCTKERRF